MAAAILMVCILAGGTISEAPTLVAGTISEAPALVAGTISGLVILLVGTISGEHILLEGSISGARGLHTRTSMPFAAVTLLRTGDGTWGKQHWRQRTI